MYPSAASEGITREQVHQWMEEGLNYVHEKNSDAENISIRISKEREVLNGILMKYCPERVYRCEELQPLQQQIKNLFATYEKELATRSDFQILSRMRSQFHIITGRIRAVFEKKPVASGSIERNRPRVLPFNILQEIWAKKVSSQRHKILTPDAALQRLNIEDETKKGEIIGRLMLASKKESEGIEYLLLDLPQEGIDKWIYLQHFREGLENVFDEMAEILAGQCPLFVQSARQVYLSAVEAIEEEARSKYVLENKESSTETMVWRSDFQRAANSATEQNFVFDYPTQQRLDAFFRTREGKEFFERQQALMNQLRIRSLKMPVRIDRKTYEQYAIYMQEVLSEFNNLATELIVPHIGKEVGMKIRENSENTLNSLNEEMEGYFQDTKHEYGASFETLRPVITNTFYLTLIARVRKELKVELTPEEQARFEALMFSDITKAKRYVTAQQEFEVAQIHLAKNLPEIIDESTFNIFIHRMRTKFKKYEAEMIALTGAGVGTEKSRDSYKRNMERVERDIRAAFAIQVPDHDSGFREVDEQGLSREVVWEELRRANTRADEASILMMTLVKENYAQERDPTLFEETLHNAVTRLCPEFVKCPADLEDLAYWLAGRVQAIEVVIPRVQESQKSWDREVNRVQFGIALKRICQCLPLQDRSINFDQLISAPAQLEPTEMNEAQNTIDRDELVNEIIVGLQRAEMRTIGAIGRKSVLDRRQKILRQYFMRVQKAVREFAENYCPETIRSKGPLMGLDSFMSELSYSGNFWIHEVGSASEEEFDTLRLKVDEAFVPTLEWAEIYLRPEEVSIHEFLDVDVGKIRPGLHDQEEDRCSLTLAGNPPPDFPQALSESSLLNADFIWKQVQDAYRAVERTLLPTLKLQGAEKDLFYRYMWRFRQLAFSLADNAAAKGPIRAIKEYEEFFGALGKIVDNFEGKYTGKLHIFLTEHLRGTRTNIEARVCHEYAQNEMRQAVAELPRPPQMPSQYTEFFNRYIRNQLASYCRDFFYSCTAPDLSEEEIRGIGIAVDTTTELLAVDLSGRVDALCKAAKKGVPTLPELRQCIQEFIAQVDINAVSVPKGTEQRFKVEVLDRMVDVITACTHPRELFQAHPHPGASETLEGTLEQETKTLLDVREEEQLAAMLQTARRDLQNSRDCLYAITDIVERIERADEAHPALASLDQAANAVCISLFVEYEATTEDDMHPRLSALYGVLSSIQRVVFDPSDPARQRAAIDALQHFMSILQGLYRSLPRPV